jgi:hypothetical protein
MSEGHAGDAAEVAAAGQRLGRIIGGVCAAAVSAAGASGIVVLEDWTPEGELAYEWLVAALGESRVWRGAALTGNVEAGAVGRPGNGELDGALVAHPANRTALLLGGRLPAADLLPLGDVTASQVEALAGSWSGPHDVEALAGEMGGAAVLDAALYRLVDERQSPDEALLDVPREAAARLLHCYGRGRWFRLRPGLTPKLSVRTLGIDLFD